MHRSFGGLQNNQNKKTHTHTHTHKKKKKKQLKHLKGAWEFWKASNHQGQTIAKEPNWRELCSVSIKHALKFLNQRAR